MAEALAGAFLCPFHVPRPCPPVSRRDVFLVENSILEDSASPWHNRGTLELSKDCFVAVRSPEVSFELRPHLFCHQDLTVLVDHSLPHQIDRVSPGRVEGLM